MKQIFYTDGTNNFGPFSKEELTERGITRETRVWFYELGKWEEAGTVPELNSLFALVPPPIMRQENITPQPIRLNSWNNSFDVFIFLSIFYLIFYSTINPFFLDDIVVEMLRSDVVNYYHFLNFSIIAIVPIIFALSVKEKKLKIIAIIFSTINFIFIMYHNIEWIIRLS